MSETRFKKLIVLSAVLGCAVCAAAAAVPELTILIFKLPCGFFVDLLWELAMTGDGWRIFAIALYVLVCLIPAAALLLLLKLFLVLRGEKVPCRSNARFVVCGKIHRRNVVQLFNFSYRPSVCFAVITALTHNERKTHFVNAAFLNISV